MKIVLIVLIAASILPVAHSQVFTTNSASVGLEHNILFNAQYHYSVTQSGSAALNLPWLFDGVAEPSYTSTGPTVSDPTVVLVEGLPYIHIQSGAWVGWTTRYWNATRFKIEGYDSYADANLWRVIADYSTQDYAGGHSFHIATPSGAYTKLRFTFYAATGVDGRLGVSELVFIHPEATSPYHNLFGTHFSEGNVGIGTATPSHKLAVNGTIRAKEIIVDTGWADYVFASDYRLTPLDEVEAHISEKGHLPGMPSAAVVAENGVSLGQMQSLLLAKIEELTLHVIEMHKVQNGLIDERDELRSEISKLKKVIIK